MTITHDVEKQYWTIGEVAEQLMIAESNVRFWCDEFDMNVHRSTTKHRKFTLADITRLQVIKILLHEQKYTVEGAKEKLELLKFPMSAVRINQEVRLQLARIIAPLLIFFMMSCSAPEKVYRVEDGLQQYVDNFFAIAVQHGKLFQKDNLIIRLTHGLRKDGIGYGRTNLEYVNGKLGQRTIEFDYDFWMSATESQRETLSLHEFGHGYLSRQHNQGYSLMNPVDGLKGWPMCSGGECDHEFLIGELFRNVGL